MSEVVGTRLMYMTESLPDPILTGSQHSLREFIDQVHDAGYVVRSDTHGDDPELIAPDGSAVETWHEVIGEPTFADAILDRLVHNAYRIALDGPSLRKTGADSRADAGQ